MNEIYTRLAEMLKKEENITIGTAYIKSTSPLVLSYNGMEIRDGIMMPPEMSSRTLVPELPSELFELEEFLEEILMARQLSRGDEVLLLNNGEESYILTKVTEA